MPEPIPLPATKSTPPDVVVVEATTDVVTVVVVAVVTALETVFERLELSVDDSAVVELEIAAEELVLTVPYVWELLPELGVSCGRDEELDAGMAGPKLLDCRAEEPMRPQPARVVVATATKSRVARATLNVFNLDTNLQKRHFHHKYFCPNVRTKPHLNSRV